MKYNRAKSEGKHLHDVRRRDGALNDDLRAVLDKLWGVGYIYVHKGQRRLSSSLEITPTPGKAEMYAEAEDVF